MENLKDIIIYLLKKYPHKSELSNARATKMIYLADWKSAIDNDNTMTNIRWKYDLYGPWVDDVVILAENDPDFIVDLTKNQFGNDKKLIQLTDDKITFSL